MNAKEARKIVKENIPDYDSCLETIYGLIKNNSKNGECYLILHSDIEGNWFSCYPQLKTTLKQDGYKIDDLRWIGGHITIRW